MRTVEWPELIDAAKDLASRHGRLPGRCGVYGIPRGGIPAALLVVQELRRNGHDVARIVDDPIDAQLIVDDLVDSGRTLSSYTSKAGPPVDALFRKPHSPKDLAPHAVEIDDWLVFPWEANDGAAGPEDAVTRLIEFVGEDPARPGLEQTPARVVKALAEMCDGYEQDPAVILSACFQSSYDEMVLVRDIEFTSLCEHHLLPFTGTCTIGYIPKAQGVVGLSKLARLVECFARRLQIQERLTEDIALALVKHLEPVGVGVVISAEHSCMSCRGVRKRAPMVTSSMHGAMRDKPEARAEFLALARPHTEP